MISPMFRNRIFFMAAWALFSACQPSVDPVLKKLDQEISERPAREKAKRQRMEQIRQKLAQSPPADSLLMLFSALAREYKSYSFDSASRYSKEYLRVARRTNSKEHILKATDLHAYILMSSGIIDPALDSLKKIRVDGLSPDWAAEHFFTLSKGFFEKSVFQSDKSMTARFDSIGNLYLDSAVLTYPKNTLRGQSLVAYQLLKHGKTGEAQKLYEDLLRRSDLPIRQKAMEAACLASTYEQQGNREKSMEFYAVSAMADEVSVVREYMSLIRLARLLFESGDLDRSSRYINLALEDANFFGSWQRKIQVLEILPLIKAQQLHLIQENRDLLIAFSFLLVVVLGFCIWLIRFSIRQNRHIRKDEVRLREVNTDLARKKTELEEARKIAEDYVGHFFQTNTRIIGKIEKVFHSIETAVRNQDLADVRFQVSQFKPDQEKRKLLKEFDKAFLTLFPDFVEKVNALLHPGQELEPEDDHSLTTELRIFALLRMGIHSNEVIARVLGYSVNTVYAYKTRVRQKSTLTSEEFDHAILNIRAVRE